MNKMNIFNSKTSWAVKILALIFFIEAIDSATPSKVPFLGENAGGEFRIIFMSVVLTGIIFLIIWVKYLISFSILISSLEGLWLLTSYDVFVGIGGLAETLLILICLIFSWEEFTQGGKENMPKLCSECGTKVNEEDAFCPKCGFNLKGDTGTIESQETTTMKIVKKKSSARWEKFKTLTPQFCREYIQFQRFGQFHNLVWDLAQLPFFSKMNFIYF